MNIPTRQTSPSRGIRCANCDVENSSDHKFCGDCGAVLWEACTECGTVNTVDGKFCGGCGANILEAFERLKAQIERKLQLAVQLEREGRFQRAEAELASISSRGDGRLKPFAENAARLLEQLEERQRMRSAESRTLSKQAKAALSNNDFAQAFELLSRIPEAIRTPEIRELFVEARSKHEEVLKLKARVRDGLQSKAFGRILGDVRRLVELQPDQQEFLALREKLEKHHQDGEAKEAIQIAKRVHQLISQQKYLSAASAAEQISSNCRTGKVEQIYRQAKELAWCSAQLKQATVVSPGLLRAAQRWKKTKPDDERVEKTIALLTPRLQYKPKDPRFGVAPWQPLQQDPAIGHRVEFWTGVAEPETDEDASKQMRLHPGRFFVAYGLALQGLGSAVLNHDLTPRKKRWNALISRKSKVERIWGLDIGSHSIKALELSKDKSEGSLTIESCLLIHHAKSLDDCPNDEARAEVVLESVESFLESAELEHAKVALSFPGRRGLARFFNLPPLKGKKVAEAVNYEIKHQIPLEIDEAVFDSHVWEPEGIDIEFRSVASIAARRVEIQAWVDPVVEAGCEVALVQCDGFAIYNALHREFFTKRSLPDDASIAVVDIGSAATNLLVASRNHVWLRSIVHGTKRWDNAIAQHLSLTKEQSEVVRRDFSQARWMHRVDEVLSQEYAELLEDLQRSLGAFPRKEENAIKFVLGAGGGFAQFGLMRYFNYGDLASLSSQANLTT